MKESIDNGLDAIGDTEWVLAQLVSAVGKRAADTRATAPSQPRFSCAVRAENRWWLAAVINRNACCRSAHDNVRMSGATAAAALWA